jgi:hypothetical protein
MEEPREPESRADRVAFAVGIVLGPLALVAFWVGVTWLWETLT